MDGFGRRSRAGLGDAVFGPNPPDGQQGDMQSDCMLNFRIPRRYIAVTLKPPLSRVMTQCSSLLRVLVSECSNELPGLAATEAQLRWILLFISVSLVMLASITNTEQPLASIVPEQLQDPRPTRC